MERKYRNGEWVPVLEDQYPMSMMRELCMDPIYHSHPSRTLTVDEWRVWAASPEGLLEILKYPKLAKMAPDQDYQRKVL